MLSASSPLQNGSFFTQDAIEALRANEIETVKELLQEGKLRANVPLDGVLPLAYALGSGNYLSFFFLFFFFFS